MKNLNTKVFVVGSRKVAITAAIPVARNGARSLLFDAGELSSVFEKMLF